MGPIATLIPTLFWGQEGEGKDGHYLACHIQHRIPTIFSAMGKGAGGHVNGLCWRWRRRVVCFIVEVCEHEGWIFLFLFLTPRRHDKE